MKLRTTLALITAAVGITALNAQVQTSSSEWTGSADVRYTTRYVFRGEKKAGQSMQANVEFAPVTGESGFYVGGWANQPFASEKDFEFDLYGGYQYLWQGFTFDGGLTGYFYPEASNNETDYTYEFNLSVSREILTNWSATGSVYYDVRLKALTWEASTGYRLPYQIEKFPASLDFSLYLGTSSVRDQFPDVSGGKIKDNYSYYGATVSTTVWFTKNIRGTLGIQYGDTINRVTQVYGYRDGSDNLYGYASVGLRW